MVKVKIGGGEADPRSVARDKLTLEPQSTMNRNINATCNNFIDFLELQFM